MCQVKHSVCDGWFTMAAAPWDISRNTSSLPHTQLAAAAWNHLRTLVSWFYQQAHCSPHCLYQQLLLLLLIQLQLLLPLPCQGHTERMAPLSTSISLRPLWWALVVKIFTLRQDLFSQTNFKTSPWRTRNLIVYGSKALLTPCCFALISGLLMLLNSLSLTSGMS